MTTQERKLKASMIRIKTNLDMKKKLKEFGKCAVIRPTGFGKTCMATDLVSAYEKVLYLYPTQVIKDAVLNRYRANAKTEEEAVDEETVELVQELDSIPNVTMMTYAKLCNMDFQKLDDMDYDLIILDECHRIGGQKTNIQVKRLFARHPDTHFVGLTATPLRTDNYDPVNDPELFNGVEVFEYTLHNAFTDGILLKPYYCYCTYKDVYKTANADFREAALMAGEDLTNPTVNEVYKREAFLAADIMKMENVVKDVCDKYAENPHDMKYIVFFSSFTHLHEKEEHVVSWFETAYPGTPVYTMTISSETKEFQRNTKELKEFNMPGIKLIFAIDMMNLGYHIDDLTGIIMYRTTISDIIFIQQLGRVLSTGNDRPGIVFDVVDNLHRKGEFGETATSSKNIVTEEEKEQALAELYTELFEENGEGVAVINEAPDDTPKDPVQEHEEVKPDHRKHCRIFAGDLIAVGNWATYRELIAKAVAESLAQRIVIAVHSHFRAWCRAKNIEYPITDRELQRLYGLSRKDFVKDLLTTIKNEASLVGYPIQSKRLLMQIGKEDDGLTLKYCAKVYKVTVKEILRMLGVETKTKVTKAA